jgi:hypothetical protein
MAEAESSASGDAFRRSARMRAFARCMGDNMETSTAGFASPFVSSAKDSTDDSEILMENF